MLLRIENYFAVIVLDKLINLDKILYISTIEHLII